MSLKGNPDIEKHIKAGMVVILRPDLCGNKMLGGCMMTITEVKDFGCQGYVQCTGARGESGGQAYYKAKWEEMDFVGFNDWNVD